MKQIVHEYEFEYGYKTNNGRIIEVYDILRYKYE